MLDRANKIDASFQRVSVTEDHFALNGHGALAQIFQISVYVVHVAFSILITFLLNFFVPGWLAFFGGCFFFFWPFTKLFIGQFLAGKDDDPRHLIWPVFLFDNLFCVKSEPLSLIRKYGALSRSLDVIYNYFGEFGVRPYDIADNWWKDLTWFKPVNLLIKKWTDILIGGMWIARDVKHRLDMIAEICKNDIQKFCISNPDETWTALEVAGGSLQTVIMGIARARERTSEFDYQVVSIENDNGFADKRARELITAFGLDEKKFVFIYSKISTNKKDKSVKAVLRQYGFDLASFRMVVNVGIPDYYKTPARVRALLDLFQGSRKFITSNVSGNRLERPFLHWFIQWPLMKYRAPQEWRGEVEKVFSDRKTEIIPTSKGVFQIAVVE